MAKKGLWITAQEERIARLKDIKRKIVLQLANDGLSFGDIEIVLGLNKGTAYRLAKKDKKV